MIGFFRLLLYGFLALSLVYLLIALYAASLRREALEKEWDSDPDRLPGDDAARATYIAEGMQAYRHSLRRKLIWGVYIVPLLLMTLLMYLVNQ